MIIYNPNVFTNRPIEAPCPVPSKSNLVIDVQYALDLPKVFSNNAVQKINVIKTIFSKSLNDRLWPIKRLAQFIQIAHTSSFVHLNKEIKNIVHQKMQLRCCSFASVAGFVHSISDDVKMFKKGDAVAAIGFLQPSLADFILVPESLTVRISRPSDKVLSFSSILFLGSAAAYVAARCLEIQRENNDNLRIGTVGQALWIDIATAMLQEHSPDVITGNDHEEQIKNEPISNSLPCSNIKKKCSIIFCANHFCNPASTAIKNEENCICFRLATEAGYHGDVNPNIITLRLPDPWIADNLNMYSELAFDLPDWCTSKYLEKYISFVEHDKSGFVVNTPFINNYSGVRKDSSQILSLGKTPHDKDRMTVGVIGAGSFGKLWLRWLTKNKTFQVRSIADRNVYNAWLAAQIYGCDVCSSDANTVLDDKSIQSVFIITDHASHTPLAIEALRHGKFVYLEKPHVVSFEQLRMLMEAVKDNPGRLHVGFNRRYAPVIVMAKKWLRSRTSPLNISFIMRLWDVPPNSFYHWPEQGTRVISNICHHLDLAYHIIGKKPLSISSLGTTVGRKDENVVVTAVFADGSLCTVLFGDRGDSFIQGEENIRIMCDELTIDIYNYTKLHIRQNGREVGKWNGSRNYGHHNCLEAFRNSITRGQTVPYSSEDVYWSGLLFLTADKALRTGKHENFIVD